MTVKTNKGERIETTETPRWNDFHKCWYVAGRRWIKSKQRFSTSVLVHNFKSYEVE